MTGESIAAIVLAATMVTLFTALLLKKRINQPNFTVLLSLTAMTCLVLHGFPRLRELDVRRMKLTLDEMKQVRTDVYARAASVTQLADRVVDVMVRLTKNNSLNTITKMESEAVQLLQNADATQQKLADTRRRFARARARELLGDLYLTAVTDDMDELPDELWSVDGYNRQLVETWCSQRGIDTKQLVPLLDAIDAEINAARVQQQLSQQPH